MSYQKTIIVGNLGHDPDVKYLDTGVCVASFSVATSDSYTNKNGERITTTEWFRCVAWNKTGEIVEKYLHKGSKVLLELKKRDREWTDEHGTVKRVAEFTVLNMQMLDPKPKPEGQPYQEPTNSGGTTGTPPIQQPMQQSANFDDTDNGPDDLPF